MSSYYLSHQFTGDTLEIELRESNDQGDYVNGTIEIKREEMIKWLFPAMPINPVAVDIPKKSNK